MTSSITLGIYEINVTATIATVDTRGRINGVYLKGYIVPNVTVNESYIAPNAYATYTGKNIRACEINVTPDGGFIVSIEFHSGYKDTSKNRGKIRTITKQFLAQHLKGDKNEGETQIDKKENR